MIQPCRSGPNGSPCGNVTGPVKAPAECPRCWIQKYAPDRATGLATLTKVFEDWAKSKGLDLKAVQDATLAARAKANAGAVLKFPCAFRGKELSGPERVALYDGGQKQITHGQVWATCGNAQFEKGGKAVTTCLPTTTPYGCGWECPGHSRHTAPPPDRIPAPNPPDTVTNLKAVARVLAQLDEDPASFVVGITEKDLQAVHRLLAERETERQAEALRISRLPRQRHLAFHIFPSVNNSTWRRAVDQLKLRWEVFTGRKVIAVVQGDGMAHLEDVADAFTGTGAEVFGTRNVKSLREVATWNLLWDRILPTAGENDLAFYGHAKAATREMSSGCMTHRWASMLYSLNLDYLPTVEEMLTRFPIVGAFKKVGNAFADPRLTFHYSGTFYWLRISDFAKRYREVPITQEWFGTESWPGVAYRARDAGCIFGEGDQSVLDLYSPRYWATHVFPEFREWIRTKNRA